MDEVFGFGIQGVALTPKEIQIVPSQIVLLDQVKPNENRRNTLGILEILPVFRTTELTSVLSTI